MTSQRPPQPGAKPAPIGAAPTGSKPAPSGAVPNSAKPAASGAAPASAKPAAMGGAQTGASKSAPAPAAASRPASSPAAASGTSSVAARSPIAATPQAVVAAPVPLAPTAVTDSLALKWNSKVACRTLEGTAFILLKSRMVSLNEVGTFIWEQFEKGSTIEGVAAQVVKQFETSLDAARTDAREFVRALVEKEMLVPVGPIT